MEEAQLKEVIECLAEGRTLYRYHRDQYALDLVKHTLKNRIHSKVSDFRKSTFGKLLNKPIFRDVLSNAGSGHICLEALNQLHIDPHTFVLTLGFWGNRRDYCCNQTSRPGCNLVLQLNLVKPDAQLINSMLGCSANEFTGYFHPVSKKRDATLAWARVDFDFDTNEALIEEIQSDLIRELTEIKETASRHLKGGKHDFFVYGIQCKSGEAIKITNSLLKKYKTIWAEAILNATIWFIKNELGFEKIYYHSFETAKVLRNLRYSFPPRSLYSNLPNKFCFEIQEKSPKFICANSKAKRRLKILKTPLWYTMEI